MNTQKLPSLELTKKQHKLKLNTSHQMIRAMVSLEDEQDALKDKSNFAKSFKRMSAGIKYLGGTSREKCLDIVAENMGVYDEKNLREVTPSIKRPNVRWSSNSTTMWMKKRGMEVNSTGTENFLKFLKYFFNALVENSAGILYPNEIIVPLLSLGLSNDAQYIERALLSIFNAENISDIQMDKEQFVNLFKGDKKNDIILKCLNFSCKEMLKEEEEKKIAQMAFRRHTTIYSQNTSTLEKTPEKKYPTIEEFIKLVRKWWNEISNDFATVNISKIAEFLAEKGMAANKHEGRVIAKSVENSSLFAYNHFEKIFLKAILKASLFNVAVFLNRNDFEDFSMRLKLAIIQRRCMMAGAKSRVDHSTKQGRITLQALDSYQKKIGNEKYKKEEKNKLSIEAAEELNEQKLIQMLFKIKENAKLFIDESGEVKGNIKNTWDIKLSLPNKEEISPTPKFKEEKYLSSFLQPQQVRNGSEPYTRKVKLFRENFLYKKFSKLIEVYPQKSDINL